MPARPSERWRSSAAGIGDLPAAGERRRTAPGRRLPRAPATRRAGSCCSAAPRRPRPRSRRSRRSPTELFSDADHASKDALGLAEREPRAVASAHLAAPGQGRCVRLVATAPALRRSPRLRALLLLWQASRALSAARGRVRRRRGRAAGARADPDGPRHRRDPRRGRVRALLPAGHR